VSYTGAMAYTPSNPWGPPAPGPDQPSRPVREPPSNAFPLPKNFYGTPPRQPNPFAGVPQPKRVLRPNASRYSSAAQLSVWVVIFTFITLLGLLYSGISSRMEAGLFFVPWMGLTTIILIGCTLYAWARDGYFRKTVKRPCSR
jgi:hypothetical protein